MTDFGDSHAAKAAPTSTRHLLQLSPQCACVAHGLEDVISDQAWRLLPPPRAHRGTNGEMEVQPGNDLPKVTHKMTELAPQASLPLAGVQLVSPIPVVESWLHQFLLCAHVGPAVSWAPSGHRQAKGTSENVLAACAHVGLPKIHSLPSSLGCLIEQETSSMGGKQCQVQCQQNPAVHIPSGGRLFT